ncbi:MAG: hypothetical protein ACYDDF_04820 [Thermoplasmatota archaeon]
MLDRSCPRCGADLTTVEDKSGSVWVCKKDGIVDWYFEATAAHAALRPPGAR